MIYRDSDLFWELFLMAFLAGVAATMATVGLWELARWIRAWRRGALRGGR